MSRYWTPTRASYLDHVSKARIVDIAMQAVSPKIALDLSKMKKGDAAASAEMRLAKSAWLPEMLTDREVPVIRALGVVNAPDDGADEDDSENPQTVEADEAGSPEPAPATGTAEADNNLPAWPFPTTASVATSDAVQHTA